MATATLPIVTLPSAADVAGRGVGPLPCLFCAETEDTVTLDPENMTFKCSACSNEWAAGEAVDRIVALSAGFVKWSGLLAGIAAMPSQE